MATIDEQISFLREEEFVKYTNTEDFPELPLETRHFLKNYGMWTYREFISDGTIKRFKKNLLEIGVNEIKDKYCIDVKTGAVVYYDMRDNSVTIYNSSVQKFLEAQYTLTYFYKEIEFKMVYGRFYEKNNHLKYAKKLREMLNKVEPTGIENFIPWEEEIYQKELGVY